MARAPLPIPCLTALCLGCGLAIAQQPKSPPAPATGTPAAKAAATKPPPSPLSPLSLQSVSSDLDSILKAVTDDGDYSAAIARLQPVFDRLVAYGDAQKDGPSFRLADQWLRLFRHLDAIPKEQRAAALKALRAHDRLAGALARVVKPRADKLSNVYEFIDTLAEKRDNTLDRFAELAVAVAVVHDAPLAYERAKAPDALEIYDYFVGIDPRATIAPSSMPAELLIHVVDTAASTDELKWALNKYPNDRQPGRHFFEIQYDTDNFKRNKPLKLDKYDFTLQNIRKVGGVCRHQAFYAAHVGKALGIPTVIDSARGSDVGHAWVGYLDITGTVPHWDLDDGRYDEYKGLKGNVLDPQTRRSTPDSQVALLAQFMSEPVENRLLAAALTDAAERLAEFAHDAPTSASTGVPDAADRKSDRSPLAGPKLPTPSGKSPQPKHAADKTQATPSYPPAITLGDAKPRPARPAALPSRLALLEEAVNASPARQDAWLAVAELASRKALSHDQIVHWSEAAVSFCGTAYPDFALDVLKPMFKAAKDPAEQDRLWEWAYEKFFKGVSDQKRRRIDLAAMIRFEQGEGWEENNQPGKAWDRYKQVIVEFPNDGPFVVTAVERCAAMLKKHEKGANDTIALYQDAWRRIKKPGEMSGEFASQSNWFRVGNAYETVLRDAGRTVEADRVRSQFRKDRDAGG